MDENSVQINLDWFDKLVANVNGTQMSLFDNDTSITGTAGAATISQAASGNTWPYPYVSTSSGTYTLPVVTSTGTGTGNISPGLTFSDTWRLPEQALHVRGDAEFEGDIKIKGKSISETLSKIEERLAILHPNKQLESKWEELKKLGDMYRALEKDILEKEQIWETLKK